MVLKLLDDRAAPVHLLVEDDDVRVGDTPFQQARNCFLESLMRAVHDEYGGLGRLRTGKDIVKLTISSTGTFSFPL